MNKYANIQSKQELLETVMQERAVSGGISELEKLFIERAIEPGRPLAMENIEDEIPHIHMAFAANGLPTTIEEIRLYIAERTHRN